LGRKLGDDIVYNQIAKEVMAKNEIRINDLHSHALKKLPEIQLKPADVHFSDDGSDYLAEQVARSIQEAIQRREIRN